MEEYLRRILSASLAAADPEEAVRRFLRLEGNAVVAGDGRLEAERVFVIAAGKAAGAMARAAEELFGERLAGGLIVTKHGNVASSGKLDVLFAAHPEPDEKGVEAARRAEELARSLEEGDLLLALISGGASALLADPAPPIELADLKELTGALLRSGANISKINTVRKHVSVLKGGGLASLTAPAPTLALLLSDVVGDEPSEIASGLTAPDPTTLEEARGVLKRYGIEPPESVVEHLSVVEETPKPGDALFEGVANVLCGALAADTDGNDGPTDAAGGLVSGATADAIRGGGVDPEEALANNDAYRALEAGGALLVTGPTGTNVNDLRVALVSGEGRTELT